MPEILFIDINEKINAFLSKKRKDSITVLKNIELPIEESGRLKDYLNSKISGLKPIKCYLSLPLSMLGFRIIELPFKDEKKITEVIPFELRERVLEDEELIFDFIRLSEEEKTKKLLVAYSKKTDLEKIFKTLSESGIEPEVITSFHLRYLLNHGFKVEDLINPPDYRDNILNILREECISPVINLRKGAFGISVEKENLIKRLKLTNQLLAIILLILSAIFLVSIIKSRRDMSAIKNLIEMEFKKEFPQETIKDEVLQLKSHIKELKERLDTMTGIPVTETFKKIKPPEGVMIDSIEMDTKGIIIKGEALELSQVETFKELLKDTGKNPLIMETSQFSRKHRFTINVNR